MPASVRVHTGKTVEFPEELRRRAPGLHLLERSDHLHFRLLSRGHLSPSPQMRKSYTLLRRFRGEDHHAALFAPLGDCSLMYFAIIRNRSAFDIGCHPCGFIGLP